jgi:hypothetical protein
MPEPTGNVSAKNAPKSDVVARSVSGQHLIHERQAISNLSIRGKLSAMTAIVMNPPAVA